MVNGQHSNLRRAWWAGNLAPLGMRIWVSLPGSHLNCRDASQGWGTSGMGSGGRRKWVSAMVLSPAAVAEFIVCSNNHPLVNFFRRGNQPETWERCDQLSICSKWIWATQGKGYTDVLICHSLHSLTCSAVGVLVVYCSLMSPSLEYPLAKVTDFQKIMLLLGGWPTSNNLSVWETMFCPPGDLGKHWRDIPVLELSVGLMGTFAATAWQFNFSLCPIRLPSFSSKYCSQENSLRQNLCFGETVLSSVDCVLFLTIWRVL